MSDRLGEIQFVAGHGNFPPGSKQRRRLGKQRQECVGTPREERVIRIGFGWFAGERDRKVEAIFRVGLFGGLLHRRRQIKCNRTERAGSFLAAGGLRLDLERVADGELTGIGVRGEMNARGEG